MATSIHKQSGHAAMLFAMIIPALFGVFMLGSDGARALQTKARLEEAAEAAVLAVSAEDSNDNALAKRYIEHYLYDVESVEDIQVERLSCDALPECQAGLERGEARYFEYRVADLSQHKSWFAGNDAIVGFGETFNVTGSSKARRYQSQALDITFVVDFSESMNLDWSGGHKSKIQDLKDIIEDVTDELDKFNKLNPDKQNRVALTGFNRRTINANSDDELIVRDQRIINKMGQYDKDDEVNFKKTIEQQFKIKGEAKRVPNGDDDARFNDIFYETNFESFNKKVKKFKAGGGTASLQGIIRAGQIITMLADKPKQLIIILSDGEDWNHYAEQTPKLVDKGMCSNIRNIVGGGELKNVGYLPDRANVQGNKSLGMVTSKGEPMSARMAVIGFDYDLKANTGLKKCVGKENVFKAENKDEILDQILALITEEVGHLSL